MAGVDSGKLFPYVLKMSISALTVHSREGTGTAGSGEHELS